jgi:hypothetical protein
VRLLPVLLQLLMLPLLPLPPFVRLLPRFAAARACALRLVVVEEGPTWSRVFSFTYDRFGFETNCEGPAKTAF